MSLAPLMPNLYFNHKNYPSLSGSLNLVSSSLALALLDAANLNNITKSNLLLGQKINYEREITIL